MAWRYFNYNDDRMLACPCCGKKGMDDAAMRGFDRIRHMAGVPMVITSGYRCPDYNEKRSSTGRTGPHTTGMAIDVAAVGTEAHKILEAALACGIMGVGVKQKGEHGKRFLHLDFVDHVGAPRPWVWSY